MTPQLCLAFLTGYLETRLAEITRDAIHAQGLEGAAFSASAPKEFSITLLWHAAVAPFEALLAMKNFARATSLTINIVACVAAQDAILKTTSLKAGAAEEIVPVEHGLARETKNVGSSTEFISEAQFHTICVMLLHRRVFEKIARALI